MRPVVVDEVGDRFERHLMVFKIFHRLEFFLLGGSVKIQDIKQVHFHMPNLDTFGYQ
jgi:hypothetical protein